MIKLLDVEDLGDSKYLLTVLNDGETEKYVLTEKSIFFEEMDKTMNFYNCPNHKFSDVWGSSLEFRKQATNQIKKIKALKSELQAV